MRCAAVFPDLRPSGPSQLCASGPSISTEAPLRRQRRRPLKLRQSPATKQITRSSSEPRFKQATWGFTDTALSTTTNGLVTGSLDTFVCRVKKAKAGRDQKRTVLRPYGSPTAVRSGLETRVLGGDTRPPFVPNNASQARLLCTQGRTGRVGSSVPYDAARRAERQAEEERKSRWVGGSFGTCSKRLEGKTFLCSADEETQQLERECTHQRIRENVEAFQRSKKPVLKKETVDYLISKKLKSISNFHGILAREYKKMMQEQHEGGHFADGQPRLLQVVKEAVAAKRR